MKRKLVGFLFIFVLCFETASASTISEKKITIDYFCAVGCGKCTKANPIIEEVINSQKGTIIFNTYDPKRGGLELAKQYNATKSPTIVINGRKAITYTDYNGNLTKLESLLVNEINTKFDVRSQNIPENRSVSLFFPLIAGFLAGLSPCLFAMFIFIGSISIKVRGALSSIITFSGGVLITSILIGIGILHLALSDSILIGIIGAVGVWYIYDAFYFLKSGKSRLHLPKFIITTIKKTQKMHLVMMFGTGMLFAIIMPVIGTGYFVVLNMVENPFNDIVYLLIYNIAMVIPMITLGVVILRGNRINKIREIKEQYSFGIKFLTGIILLFSGLLMYIKII